jgi:hypothetical protein
MKSRRKKEKQNENRNKRIMGGVDKNRKKLK